MSEQVNYVQIDTMINVVYKGHWDEYPKGKSISDAMKIFKKIKDFEKYDKDGNVDYDMELNMAKGDLFWVFDIKGEELNKMSKNNIYMLHQSKLVNAIYKMLNKEQ